MKLKKDLSSDPPNAAPPIPQAGPASSPGLHPHPLAGMVIDMQSFQRSVDLPISQANAFAYHERQLCLQRMLPPWIRLNASPSRAGIQVGTTVDVVQSVLGIPIRTKAEHVLYQPPSEFADRMLRGPFSHWFHRHLFHGNASSSQLTDSIEYQIRPPFALLPGVANWVRRQIEAMFAFRHHVLLGDCQLANLLPNSPQKIALTGSSGLLGSRIASLLSVLGHHVIRVVRHPTRKPNETSWDPQTGLQFPQDLADCHAIIHLAGENIAGRWTPQKKERLRSSRVDPTQRLVQQLLQLDSPPAFISASGIGFYGDCGEDEVTESHPAGSDFLAQLATDWEMASQPYEDRGLRRCIGRLAMVVHPNQGALGSMRWPFLFGLGGRIGPGSAYWSWIELDDAASAFVWMALRPESHGIYNLCSPQTLTSLQWTQTFAMSIHRSHWLPTPAFALQLLLGEMAQALLLCSCRALPQRLLEEHFPFRSPSLAETLALWQGRPIPSSRSH